MVVEMKKICNRLVWIELQFQPTYFLIGVYWEIKDCLYGSLFGKIKQELHLYIGLIPCIQVHVIIGFKSRKVV